MWRCLQDGLNAFRHHCYGLKVPQTHTVIMLIHAYTRSLHLQYCLCSSSWSKYNSIKQKYLQRTLWFQQFAWKFYSQPLSCNGPNKSVWKVVPKGSKIADSPSTLTSRRDRPGVQRWERKLGLNSSLKCSFLSILYTTISVTFPLYNHIWKYVPLSQYLK